MEQTPSEMLAEARSNMEQTLQTLKDLNAFLARRNQPVEERHE